MNFIIKSTDIFEPNTYWKIKEIFDRNPKRINREIVYRFTLKFDRSYLTDERFLDIKIPESKAKHYPDDDAKDHINYLLNLQLTRAAQACKNANIQSHHYAIQGDDLDDKHSLIVILEKETKELVYSRRGKHKAIMDAYLITPDLPWLQEEFARVMAKQFVDDIKNGKINLSDFRKKD